MTDGIVAPTCARLCLSVGSFEMLLRESGEETARASRAGWVGKPVETLKTRQERLGALSMYGKPRD